MSSSVRCVSSGTSISCSLQPSNPELVLWLLLGSGLELSAFTPRILLLACLARWLLWRRCCLATRGTRESSLRLFLLFLFLPGFTGSLNTCLRFLRQRCSTLSSFFEGTDTIRFLCRNVSPLEENMWPQADGLFFLCRYSISSFFITFHQPFLNQVYLSQKLPETQQWDHELDSTNRAPAQAHPTHEEHYLLVFGTLFGLHCFRRTHWSHVRDFGSVKNITKQH